jgi:putative redox protein
MEPWMPIDPKGTILSFNLSGKGIGVLQTVAIEGSPHTIRAEGHPAFGGKDSAPSPLDYALAALASCNQVTAFIVARDHGIALRAFEIDVHAELDNSVLVFGAGGNPNFSTVTLDVRVETGASDEEFTKLASEIERRCPLTQLYVRSGVKVVNKWRNQPLTGQAAAA